MKYLVLRKIPGMNVEPNQLIDVSDWRPRNVQVLERQGRIRLAMEQPPPPAGKVKGQPS